MNLDLATLDTVAAANQGTDVEILHPTTGEAIGLILAVCGSDSDVYRKALRRRLDDRLKRQQKRGPQAPLTAAELEAETIDLLVTCTVMDRCRSVRMVEEKADREEPKQVRQEVPSFLLSGADLPFTPENVRTLYTRFPFIKEQVDEVIGDRSRFLRD